MGDVSETLFRTLEDKVAESTLNGIKKMRFKPMTAIQVKTVLQSRDCSDGIIIGKTGSEKVFAILIPAVEHMHKIQIDPRSGTCVMVVSPNREICMQTYNELKELIKNQPYSHTVLMDGILQQEEAQKLITGINILVATPKRLLDHMQHTRNFLYKHLQYLVIDEIDKILDSELEEEMKSIIRLLPKTRHTVMFASTLTQRTKAFARLALKKKHSRIFVKDAEDDEEEVENVEGLKQGYVVCPSDKRFQLLLTFLKKNRKRKMMVFFSSAMSVTFHTELLGFEELPVTCVHGKLKQSQRKAVFSDFCTAPKGILLCTDIAMRGLDIPPVDWVIQYDPPDDIKEFIRRTAKANTLLFLRPQETDLLQLLKRFSLQEYDFSVNRVANVQNQLERLTTKVYALQKSAQDAFKAYVRAYRSHPLKKVYDAENLDLKAVARSFGLQVPPFVSM